MINVQQMNIGSGIHALEVHLPSSSEYSVIAFGLTPFGAFLPPMLDLNPDNCEEKKWDWSKNIALFGCKFMKTCPLLAPSKLTIE